MLHPSEYIENLVENVNNLKTSPNLGRIYLYVNKRIIRKFVYKEHIILYYIETDTIHIVSVVHHKQDLKSKLKFIKNKFKK